MLELQIIDDTTDTTIPVRSAERTRDLDEQARATVVTYRSDWLDVGDINKLNATLTAREDGDVFFAGRLGTAEIDGATVRVEIESFEADARDAQPTGPNLQFQNVDDTTIVTDAIDAVPGLSAGAVETVATGISYHASHASQAKVLRDLRAATGAELRYNADQTVDYVERLGSDRTGEVLLSPRAETLGEGIQREQDVREEVTHVRVLGAQEGPNQVVAEAVADSYDGGRQRWRRHSNKEIVEQSRAEETAETLVSEFDGEARALSLTVTCYDVDLELGDTVQIKYPEAGIERRSLRVVSLRTIREPSGPRQEATLSNRELTRQQNERAREGDDLQRFNRGFQGFIDRDTFRAVERQPVSAGTPATGEYPYPDDVVDEVEASVTVRALPYRAYSSGAEDNADLTNIEQNGSGIQTTTVSSTGFTTVRSFTVDASPNVSAIYTAINFNSTDLNSFNYRLFDATTGAYYPRDFAGTGVSVNAQNTATGFATVQENVAGDTFEWQVSAPLSGDVTTSSWYQTSGKHTHDPDPGVIEAFPDNPDANADDELLPSNVDLVINGDTVATDIGSGEFTTEVDISGVLTPGVNDISVESDSLGLISAYVETQLFRRGRSDT